MARLIDLVVGHQTKKDEFLFAIESNKLTHSFLFVGVEGIGKLLMAKALAQVLICEKDPLGCGKCPSCLRVELGQSENLLTIESDGPFIKVEQSRKILQFLQLRFFGRSRIVIVNDAHLFNRHAANALLKVIEEPPPKTYFFLVTHKLSALLPTIRSRCQIVQFVSLKSEEIRTIVGFESKICNSLSQGSVLLAKKLQDDHWSELRMKAIEYIESLFAGDFNGLSIKEFLKDRADAFFVLLMLQSVLRDACVSLIDSSKVFNIDQMDLIQKLALCGSSSLSKGFQLMLSCEKNMGFNVDRTLLFEDLWIQLSDLLLGGSNQ